MRLKGIEPQIFWTGIRRSTVKLQPLALILIFLFISSSNIIFYYPFDLIKKRKYYKIMIFILKNIQSKNWNKFSYHFTDDKIVTEFEFHNLNENEIYNLNSILQMGE